MYATPGARLPRLTVDRRGRFLGACVLPTEGIAAVRGRFHGRRPRLATLVARRRFGLCRATSGFRLRPVRRVRVQGGAWSGIHVGGGTISFDLVNTERKAF